MIPVKSRRQNYFAKRAMAAAASGRLAATAARHAAAAAALHALLAAVPDDASRAAARLNLRELAAALGVELQRQAHQGGGGPTGLAKTRRRREQRRAALARLRSSSAAHGIRTATASSRTACAATRRGWRAQASMGLGFNLPQWPARRRRAATAASCCGRRTSALRASSRRAVLRSARMVAWRAARRKPRLAWHLRSRVLRRPLLWLLRQ